MWYILEARASFHVKEEQFLGLCHAFAMVFPYEKSSSLRERSFGSWWWFHYFGDFFSKKKFSSDPGLFKLDDWLLYNLSLTYNQYEIFENIFIVFISIKSNIFRKFDLIGSKSYFLVDWAHHDLRRYRWPMEPKSVILV